jgi:hypothetical protein
MAVGCLVTPISCWFFAGYLILSAGKNKMSDDLLLLKLLGRDFRDNWPSWKIKILGALSKWRNQLLIDLSKLLVLALCVWGGYIVFLYYLQSIWLVFAETPMGQIFATRVSPEMVTAITDVLDLELSQVATSCVINILLITVPVGVFSKFLGLYRRTFLNRGFMGYLFWAGLCTALSAELLPITEGSALQGDAAIYFLPALGLLAGAFALSARLVPEFTVVFEFAAFIRERSKIIKIRDQPYERQEI